MAELKQERFLQAKNGARAFLRTEKFRNEESKNYDDIEVLDIRNGSWPLDEFEDLYAFIAGPPVVLETAIPEKPV